ncbi:hypothetical protein E1A91_A01G238100v1 [Gossypium mustelinum]|uniref:Uncharacterized protein n=4 Tax=Gossypium TaxID=3633 RepID=A0A5J5X2C2_GOSBA|nr:hypothetical protein ES319_A01G232800v1 [Gossypium barbadense]TYH32420.1 hypothetical protein ES288_A01G251100v1 [Gossypium darwinii]TYI44735.1 hypothetical protein ES332_A01G258600v1 [Gossypium tomentosum]TYJ50858.1 hypothetical protein E1A91_A01G238100v1 [Gossypium mustelinum]
MIQHSTKHHLPRWPVSHLVHLHLQPRQGLLKMWPKMMRNQTSLFLGRLVTCQVTYSIIQHSTKQHLPRWPMSHLLHLHLQHRQGLLKMWPKMMRNQKMLKLEINVGCLFGLCFCLGFYFI